MIELMSVEQPRIIDVISIETESGHAVLTISDHLDWTDCDFHMRVLQDKLNYYLAFIESGEILDSYPSAGGRHIVIEVIFKYPPLPPAQRLLQRVRQIIEGGGFSFRYSHLSIA